MIHYGLIAGLTYTEMHRMAPGLVCDLYVLRLRYDDMENGIKRATRQMFD